MARRSSEETLNSACSTNTSQHAEVLTVLQGAGQGGGGRGGCLATGHQAEDSAARYRAWDQVGCDCRRGAVGVHTSTGAVRVGPQLARPFRQHLPLLPRLPAQLRTVLGQANVWLSMEASNSTLRGSVDALSFLVENAGYGSSSTLSKPAAVGGVPT